MSSFADAFELDAPLSLTNGQGRGDAKEIENERYASVFVPLPNLEYRKVNISSDSKSEAAHSESDSARPLICARDYSVDHSSDRCFHPETHILTVTDDFATEKLIHSASVPEPSLFDPEIDLKAGDFSSIATPAAAVGLGSEEINWQQAEQKTDASASSDLINFDEVYPLPNAMENLVDVARETSAGDTGNQVVKDYEEVSCVRSAEIPMNETELYSKPEPNEISLQTSSSFDLGDAYKLAVGNRGRQLSGKFLEQRSFKDSTRMSEDLKGVLTQLSAARGTDSILSEMSSRVSVNIEEIRTSESSSSIGMQIPQKRMSLERNESGLSLQGSAVSEIKGVTVSDRMKRKVEYDRKLMAASYKQLKEERNVSSLSENQAMAMITRLQEKAALHMEALQCLRMMEEQAEYDNEALRSANDLLAQKEKEIQDLEAEFELYKKKLGNMALFEDTLEASYDSNRAKQDDTICSDGSSTVSGNVNADKPIGRSKNGEVVTSSGVDNIDNRNLCLILKVKGSNLCFV